MAAKPPSFVKRRKGLTLVKQLAGLMAMYPDSIGTLSRGKLRWSCDHFQASALSNEYTIEIVGKCGEKPKVWLSGGSIDQETACNAPHKYGIDEGPRIQLCLERFDWKPWQSYSSTFISWAMEWIIYFEIWCVTKEWMGGGLHPSRQD